VTAHPSRPTPRPTFTRPGAASEPERVAVAFLARVSTDDQQDPTLSLPRQLASCQAALPDCWEITAYFWDIESGRMAPERRGRGRAHEHIDVPVPRDGGLVDLLAEAEYPRRRFDAVICESIDRLARRTYIGTRIEHDLEQVGVRLYASDEPIDPRGKRSTSLLTRRVKQGVAEWYVTDMLGVPLAMVSPRHCGTRIVDTVDRLVQDPGPRRHHQINRTRPWVVVVSGQGSSDGGPLDPTALHRRRLR
jgi:hypothetical protein